MRYSRRDEGEKSKDCEVEEEGDKIEWKCGERHIWRGFVVQEKGGIGDMMRGGGVEDVKRKKNKGEEPKKGGGGHEEFLRASVCNEAGDAVPYTHLTLPTNREV